MVFESLISKIQGWGKIHRIQGELACAEAALLYEQELEDDFGIPSGTDRRPPRFDLILLGMGTDGHTASLFPGSPAVDETKRWVVAVDHDQPPEPLVRRVTVTLPVINAASRVVFLVTGMDKAERVAQILTQGAESGLPAARVEPRDGELVWLLDAAAASLLPRGDQR
jgi:6-phosphogluconolactonase